MNARFTKRPVRDFRRDSIGYMVSSLFLSPTIPSLRLKIERRAKAAIHIEGNRCVLVNDLPGLSITLQA